MPVITEKLRRGRGRPRRDEDKKTDRQFHLVLLEEEMALFVIAAELADAASIGAFLRAAIRELVRTPGLVTKVPKELLPEADETTKHCPLLLSNDDMEKIHMVGARNYSAYIRTAGLAACFNSPGRSEALELAVEALRNKKRATRRAEVGVPSSDEDIS